MNSGRSVWMVVAALLTVLLCRAAWSEEDAGGPAAKGRPFRPGAEGRPGLMQGPGAVRPMVPGMDIPLVADEVQRHMEALRNLVLGQRELARQVAAEGKALREKNTPPAEADKALADKFGTQAQAIATQLADEMARHYEALTKIYKENREELLKQLAQSVLRRMASREPGQRPGGPAGFEKGARPFPKGKEAPPKGKDAMPENF